MEKSGLQKNFEKKIDLENFKPLYTNKKVQLQLDFLISVSRGRCGLRKTFNRETTFNIFYGTSQANHIYIFINIKV